MNKIMIDLLLKIHFYYPIGLPFATKEYSGDKEISQIVAKKIDQITNNETTEWACFLNDSRLHNKTVEVDDLSYFQFPSYTLEIPLTLNTFDNLTITKNIIVSVSLLTDHYTIFFEDRFIYRQMPNDLSRYKGAFSVVYFVSNTNQSYIKLLEIIKRDLKKHFSSFTFVPHSLLMSTIIEGGIPYKKFDDYLDDRARKFSMYEFLFNSNIELSRITVLE